VTETTRKDMPGRLLRLLSLLQSRREWSGSELAERLGVTDRTVRRDVERLRALDYPVEGTTGTAGGYRLTSGSNLPPLLLDDEEAVAVAVGLVMAAGGGVAGIEESSMRALAKLRQTLPARLRPRLSALGGTALALPPGDTPRVDPAILADLAAACRDHQIVTFGYRSRAGDDRRVEPHHLVMLRGLWYLIAYDLVRDDWRTFRVDRVDGPARTHRTFTPRTLPAPDPVTHLTRSLADATYRYTVHLTVELPAETLQARLFVPVRGTLKPLDERRCAVRISADSLDLTVQYVAAIAALGAGFTLDAPPEVTGRLATLARRLPQPPAGEA
jgi:predicted DNA-binding transcriptional regulator YafY